MRSLYFSANSDESKNVGRHFCFACTSTWKNDEISNFLLKEVPLKVLQDYYRKNPKLNQKVYGVFLEMIGNDTAM